MLLAVGQGSFYRFRHRTQLIILRSWRKGIVCIRPLALALGVLLTFGGGVLGHRILDGGIPAGDLLDDFGDLNRSGFRNRRPGEVEEVTEQAVHPIGLGDHGFDPRSEILVFAEFGHELARALDGGEGRPEFVGESGPGASQGLDPSTFRCLAEKPALTIEVPSGDQFGEVASLVFHVSCVS